MSVGRGVFVLLLLAVPGAGCGPPVDVLSVMQGSRSRDPAVAGRAREILERYILERRVPLFREALGSDDPEDRQIAIECLGRIGTPEAAAALVGELAPDRKFPLTLEPITGERLRRPRDSRMAVAEVLARIGAPAEAVPVAAPGVRSADPEARVEAIQILSILRHPAAAPHLAPLADDPVEAVQQAAVEALGRLAVPETLPVLVRKATDPAAGSRRAALSALQRFRDPRVLDPLLAAYEREGDPEVRLQMVSLLGRYPDPRVVSALIPALRSGDLNLRQTAENRLCELTHRRPGLPPGDWERWWEREEAGYQFPR